MTLQEFMSSLLKQGFEEAQITEKKEIREEIEIIQSEMIKHSFDDTTHYLIKASKNDITVNASSEYLDQSVIELLLEKSQYLEKRFREKVLSDTTCHLSSEIGTNIDSLKEIGDKLCDAYNIVRRNPEVIMFEASVVHSQSIVHIISTNQVDLSTKSENYILNIDLTGEKNGQKVTRGYSEAKINLDFNVESQVLELMKTIQMALDIEPIENKKYSIILKPTVSSYIFSSLISMLNAELIRKGQSLLEDSLNKKVFSSLLTILEEPQNKQYPGNQSFDDEGTMTFNKKIIAQGVLNTYLYNNKNALEDNTVSTGNGYGNGIFVSNYYNEPGELGFEELEAKMENGLVFEDMMTSNIDSASGNISLQVFGYQVKNGKRYKGLKPCILTTDIKELLNSLIAVGNDLIFVNTRRGATSVLFEGISVVN